MPTITLPDGKTKSFDKPVSGLEVAASIGAGLAKAALAIKVDGEARDLSHVIDRDASIAIITSPKPGQAASAEALTLMRHSAAHVMAEAIQDVVGKEVLLAYGPPTDTGFFYDMFVPEGKKISSDHFEAINRRMAEIIKEDRPFIRYELPIPTGFDKLKAEGSKYKLDNAQRAVEAGAKSLSWYATGRLPTAIDTSVQLPTVPFPEAQQIAAEARRALWPWEDLCRGPHVPSTSRIGAACVLSLASSYWHGDENSDRLIRVYGTAFPTQADLDQYLRQREEASKRDHRVIGKALRLFHIDETVGQGLILWTPKGAIVRKELQAFITAPWSRMKVKFSLWPICRTTPWRFTRICLVSSASFCASSCWYSM